jgi:hypothetical protein
VKYSVLLILVLNLVISISSQNPISWDIQYNKEENKINFDANIDKGWHLYAVNVPEPNEGPLPTIFEFYANSSYLISGKIEQGKPHMKFDKDFGVKIAYYRNKARFSQKIITELVSSEVSGEIKFMTCNKEKCLPFSHKFTVKINHQN